MTEEETRMRIFEAVLRNAPQGADLRVVMFCASMVETFIGSGLVHSQDHWNSVAAYHGFMQNPPAPAPVAEDLAPAGTFRN